MNRAVLPRPRRDDSWRQVVGVGRAEDVRSASGFGITTKWASHHYYFVRGCRRSRTRSKWTWWRRNRARSPHCSSTCSSRSAIHSTSSSTAAWVVSFAPSSWRCSAVSPCWPAATSAADWWRYADVPDNRTELLTRRRRSAATARRQVVSSRA